MMGLKYRLNHNCARSCYKWTSVCCKNTEVECLNEKKAKAGQMNGKPGLCKEIRNEAKQNFLYISPGIPLLCRFCFLQLGRQGTRALQRSLKQISSWNEMERSKVSLTFSFSFDFSYKCIKVWIKNGGLWAGQLLGFKRIRFFLRLLWMHCMQLKGSPERRPVCSWEKNLQAARKNWDYIFPGKKFGIISFLQPEKCEIIWKWNES